MGNSGLQGGGLVGAGGGSEVAAQSSWPCWGRGWPWITCGEMGRAPDTFWVLLLFPIHAASTPPPCPARCPPILLHPLPPHPRARTPWLTVPPLSGELWCAGLLGRSTAGLWSCARWRGHGWRPSSWGSPRQLTQVLIASSTVGPCQGWGWVRRGFGEASGEVRGAVVGPQGKGGNEDIGYRI